MNPVLQLQISPALIGLVVLAIVFYFIAFRPARKQMALQKERQEEIRNGSVPGARVMLASGLFGTIRHVGERQVVLELAPGLEVTVVREAIGKIVTPDDEDFEFIDSDEASDSVEDEDSVEDQPSDSVEDEDSDSDSVEDQPTTVIGEPVAEQNQRA